MIETAIQKGQRLWAFMHAPREQYWTHVNWGPIPILMIHSEQDAIAYYTYLETGSWPKSNGAWPGE